MSPAVLVVVAWLWLTVGRVAYVVIRASWLREFGEWTRGDRRVTAAFCILGGPLALLAEGFDRWARGDDAREVLLRREDDR